jgi:ATP-dependent RNA helicase RhlE
MDILQLESRSWKGNDPVSPMTPNASPYKAGKAAGNGFRGRSSNGGGFAGGRNSGGRGFGSNSGRSSNRPGGSSRSGPARRAQ